MKRTIQVQISGNNITSIYDDVILKLLPKIGGKIKKVKRLSHVEYENGGWTVRSAANRSQLALRLHDGRVVVSRRGKIKIFKTRKEALKNEVRMVWKLIAQ